MSGQRAVCGQLLAGISRFDGRRRRIAGCFPISRCTAPSNGVCVPVCSAERISALEKETEGRAAQITTLEGAAAGVGCDVTAVPPPIVPLQHAGQPPGWPATVVCPGLHSALFLMQGSHCLLPLLPLLRRPVQRGSSPGSRPADLPGGRHRPGSAGRAARRRAGWRAGGGAAGAGGAAGRAGGHQRPAGGGAGADRGADGWVGIGVGVGVCIGMRDGWDCCTALGKLLALQATLAGHLIALSLSPVSVHRLSCPAADLESAKEQAAGLAQQLASLAADKSGLDEAQATLSGQLTQLQVRGVAVAVACLLDWIQPSHNVQTTDRVLCSSPRATPFASTSSACRRSWPSCGPTRRRMPPSMNAACKCVAEWGTCHWEEVAAQAIESAEATWRCRSGAHVGAQTASLLPPSNLSRRRWTLRRSGSSLQSSCRPSRASCRRRWRERMRSCRWVESRRGW